MPCQEQHHILPSVAVQAGGTIRETETEVLVASIGGGMQVGRLAIPLLGTGFVSGFMPCHAVLRVKRMACHAGMLHAVPCHAMAHMPWE